MDTGMFHDFAPQGLRSLGFIAAKRSKSMKMVTSPIPY